MEKDLVVLVLVVINRLNKFNFNFQKIKMNDRKINYLILFISFSQTSKLSSPAFYINYTTTVLSLTSDNSF